MNRFGYLLLLIMATLIVTVTSYAEEKAEDEHEHDDHQPGSPQDPDRHGRLSRTGA